DNGWDPEDSNYGNLPLSYFAVGHADVLKLLFDRGANPKVVVDYHGDGLGPQESTLLHQAAFEGSVDSAQLLLDKGLNVNAKTPAGATPLHEACRYGKIEMIRWLFKHGANGQARDRSGKLPLDYIASGYDSPELIALLRLYGGAPAGAKP